MLMILRAVWAMVAGTVGPLLRLVPGLLQVLQ
jgi:hypothetical protein